MVSKSMFFFFFLFVFLFLVVVFLFVFLLLLLFLLLFSFRKADIYEIKEMINTDLVSRCLSLFTES